RRMSLNEIKLSTDINVITAEINSYKQVAGQAIFEIGRRLKHVKENDLVHGEWIRWLESIDFTARHAQRFIKVTEEIGENTTSMSHLGIAVMYEIATIPEEEREKEHVTSKGETKTVEKMTVRELQEVKRKNKELEQRAKQAEEQAESARTSEQNAIRQLEEMEDREPEVIKEEVTKEVVPDHIKHELESTKRQLDFVNRKLKSLESENNHNEVDFDEKQAEKERKRLEWEAEKNVLKFKIQVDEFLKEAAITAFMKGAIASSNETTKNKLKSSVDELKEFTKQMETVLSGR